MSHSMVFLFTLFICLLLLISLKNFGLIYVSKHDHALRYSKDRFLMFLHLWFCSDNCSSEGKEEKHGEIGFGLWR